jgi:hypothetical protein
MLDVQKELGEAVKHLGDAQESDIANVNERSHFELPPPNELAIRPPKGRRHAHA